MGTAYWLSSLNVDLWVCSEKETEKKTLNLARKSRLQSKALQKDSIFKVKPPKKEEDCKSQQHSKGNNFMLIWLSESSITLLLWQHQQAYSCSSRSQSKEKHFLQTAKHYYFYDSFFSFFLSFAFEHNKMCFSSYIWRQDDGEELFSKLICTNSVWQEENRNNSTEDSMTIIGIFHKLSFVLFKTFRY